jgi:RimJ/RimL family protein N-acetyltransferase
MAISVSRPGGPIRLRPVEVGDAEAILGWLNDTEITKNFAGFGNPISLDEERAFLARMANSSEDRLFAIVPNTPVPSGLDAHSLPILPILGTVGLHRIYWPARNARLGIMVGARDHQGRGLGQEALRLIIAFAFEALDLHKVWLVHYADNERMRHVATKLGMSVEGVLRDEYFHAGRYHDMVRHALLRPDWERRAADDSVTFV